MFGKMIHRDDWYEKMNKDLVRTGGERSSYDHALYHYKKVVAKILEALLSTELESLNFSLAEKNQSGVWVRQDK